MTPQGGAGGDQTMTTDDERRRGSDAQGQTSCTERQPAAASNTKGSERWRQ
jgi:hypothetical protein